MDDDHDHDHDGSQESQESQDKGLRMYEAREALGISQKTLVDWLRREGYDLDAVVTRADHTDLRQRYIPSEVVEAIARRHVRMETLERWRETRDLQAENRALAARLRALELEVRALRLLEPPARPQHQRVERLEPPHAVRVYAPSTPPDATPDTPSPALPLPALPARRSPVATRPLRPIRGDERLRWQLDLQIPLDECAPLPVDWIAFNTCCSKHGIDQRSMRRTHDEQGEGPDYEARDDDLAPWRHGNQRIRTAYTREQHLAACIFMAEKWPQRFIPSCGPACPYPEYLALRR